MSANADRSICWPDLFLSLQSSRRTMINPEFNCFALLPNPGTRNNNLLISPLPTFGKNIFSIS